MSSVAALLLRTMVLAIFAIVFMGIGAYFGPQVLRPSAAAPAPPPVIAQGSPPVGASASTNTTAVVPASASAPTQSAGTQAAPRSAPRQTPPARAPSPAANSNTASGYISLRRMSTRGRDLALSGLDQVFCRFHRIHRSESPQAYENAAPGTDEQVYMDRVRDLCKANFGRS